MLSRDIGQVVGLEVCIDNRASHHSLSILESIDPAILGHWFLPIFLLAILVFMALATLCVWYVGGKVIRFAAFNEDILITFLLLVIMLTVLAGEFIGINLIVGSFIAGLALSPLLKQKGINATAGERNEAIEINTTSSTAINSPVRTAPAELISSAYACLAGT